MRPDDVEPDRVGPDELKPDDAGTKELDDAKFMEAGEDGPTGVDGEDASPDEVGLDRLGTEEVGSFESDGGDMKPTFGIGISRVNDATPSDVMPDDGLPDDAERDKPVVKREAVPDDEGLESERLDGGCVSDDIDSLDDEDDDAGLGDKVGTVADEPSEVRSDEPRRTLVMKPEDVKAGHEGLKEDREEEAGPETAEEGVTSEPDKISVELEPKLNDASWVVDPRSEDVVPNDSVVDTPRDERSDDGDPKERVSDDVRPDGAESDWDISDDVSDADTKLDGAELHVDIVEGPVCVLVADPDDDNPVADEADATDSKEVPEDTGPDELDATRLEEVTPYDAGSDDVRSEDDGGTVDSELDETVLGITEPEGGACNDADVADVELGESASVDCELDDSGLVDSVSEGTGIEVIWLDGDFTTAGADEKISDAGPDEAGPEEVEPDVVWPENVKLDDGILWKRDLCNSGRLLEDTRSTVAWLETADPEISDAEETGFVADCGSEDVAEIDNSIAFEEVSTINVFDEVRVDVSGSELDKTDEARPEDCGGTPEEVTGVAKTERDDAEIEKAELGDPMAEDARSDETAYDDGSEEEAVPDEDTFEEAFEEVPSTLDEVAVETPRLSDSALALVDWSLCEVSATRVVPLDLNAGTRDVCELDS
ncbi:hypothetical protein E4U60_006956 [Claviceps pazoutovae]|uniref:Uncharacterized protein n=1 Tax=Claviceps pazoutovae TaxID=1649127 RepID=A0A9P7MG30_9HYPO|nr:hypothetical protein E4U60_006956 [Claviceps pazoutovae]